MPSGNLRYLSLPHLRMSRWGVPPNRSTSPRSVDQYSELCASMGETSAFHGGTIRWSGVLRSSAAMSDSRDFAALLQFNIVPDAPSMCQRLLSLSATFDRSLYLRRPSQRFGSGQHSRTLPARLLSASSSISPQSWMLW